jgi:hypothetical protein
MPQQPTREAVAEALLVGLESEIEQRLSFRRWYRTSAIGRFWYDLAGENDRELRKALAELRRARLAARAASRTLADGDFSAYPEVPA